MLPGAIKEEVLMIANNCAINDITLNISVFCYHEKFDQLDEYVYSLRKPSNDNTCDYDDRFTVNLSPKAISYYRVAVKIPNTREP